MINKQVVYKWFDLYSVEENAEEKNKLQEKILVSLQEIAVPTAADLHLWGLTYYFSDENREANLQLALEKFRAAWEADRSLFLSCLYIAHCYQDSGVYQQALRYYLLVDKDTLKAFQAWRYVKLLEQIAFCKHQLGQEKEAQKLFQKMLKEYKKLSPAERPIPNEMAQCLDPKDPVMIATQKLFSEH